MIPDAVIEEIRGRVDVVAVIGRHMELKRSGRTWKGCCVFHGERTPSFHVYPEDKHFKCYGCGEYGDVFKFLQRLQGKEFPEVVRELAAEVGVEIPAEEEESGEQKLRRKERNEALLACDAAARYYAARLWSRYGGVGQRYLAARGVKEETAKLFRLGLAAPEWNDLSRRLVEKSVGEAALRRAGLVVEKQDGGGYDRFRDRLVFPIAGLDGQVIGFGGRALGQEKGAKYINTPETLLYKKSKVLYGLDLARETIRKTRSAVLVEGYFDVIGLHQAGVANAVAVCGTALTPEHVELLKRCDCREVTVLFDGDPAGLAAPAKAAEALLPSGVSGKVAVLPAEGGKIDPDEFARERGRSGVDALLAAAVPLSDFLIDRAVARARSWERRAQGQPDEAGSERAGGAGGLHPPESIEAKIAAVRELQPMIRLAPEGLARSVFEERIARKLDLDLGALRAELERAPGTGTAKAREAPERPSEAGTPRRGTLRPSAHRLRAPDLLPGPALDALGLLIAFAELADVAADEDLPRLLPEGPIAEVARDAIREPQALEAVLSRLAPVLGEATLSRIKKLSGEARPRPEHAERELRVAAVKAKIERLDREWDGAAAEVARVGSPVPEELATRQLRLFSQRADLQKRLKSLERG